MQTPDTPRGRETERLMALWRQQNPDADSSAYNREWESVYGKLEFLDGDELTQAKLDYIHEQLVKDSEAVFTDSEGRRYMYVKADPGALTVGDNARRYMLKADDTRHQGGFIAGHPPKRRRVKNVRPATKGAFSKPKHLRLR